MSSRPNAGHKSTFRKSEARNERGPHERKGLATEDRASQAPRFAFALFAGANCKRRGPPREESSRGEAGMKRHRNLLKSDEVDTEIPEKAEVPVRKVTVVHVP